MFTWFNQLRDRLVKRRAERRATAGERAQRQNEAEALKYKQEQKQGAGKGPMTGPGF
jgi:hypothetical protein